jgi:heat shock protein HtpX
MGNAVQGPLNYRGLSRPTVWIGLIAALIVSSYVAAIPLLIMLLSVVGLSAGSIAFIGIAATGALILIPTWALVSGTWGMLRAKSKAIRFFNAERLPDSHPLAQVTASMAAFINLPAPEVYVYPDDDINAWATGTPFSGSAIAVSRGALRRLSREHMHAVIGHELGHIASGDIARMQFALSFQNATVGYFMFRGLKRAAGHTAGFVGQLGILGLSRRREYWADAVGAILTNPDIMSAALRTVEREAKRPPKGRKYLNQLMFNWPGSSFLSSHPTFRQRYDALEQGAFYATSLRRMGGRVQAGQPASVIGDWMRRTIYPVTAAIAVLLLVTWLPVKKYLQQVASGMSGVEVTANSPMVRIGPSAPITGSPNGPRVAGWQASIPPSPVMPNGASPKKAALPHYPKEPRYEPDETLGDPQLTPYQLLVEHGTACVYHAGKDKKQEHHEDRGPDGSDLLLHTMPLSEPYAETILGLVGSAVTECWKKYGGERREPDLMKRAKLPYDVWVLTDPETGATAECGIWQTARRVRNGVGGMGGYCR